DVGARLTVIKPDGWVVIDSDVNPSTMVNHATPSGPEFMAALAGRIGSTERKSETTGLNYLYVAIPIAKCALLRAKPLSNINSQVNSIRAKMLTATAAAFLPAILIAAFLARCISKRLADIIAYTGELAKGNYRAKLDVVKSGELGILSSQLKEAGE